MHKIKCFIKKILGFFFLIQCIGGICAICLSLFSEDKVPAITIVIIFIFTVLCAAIAYLLLKKSNEFVSSSPSINSLDRKIATAESNSTINHATEQHISDNGTPNPIQQSYINALNAEKNSKNPKFHRTAKEEELSFNFMMKYEDKASGLIENFQSLYSEACNSDDVFKQIVLLNESIKAFEKAKKFCYSKGKGGTIYFQDMWEFLHNSKKECFSYLDIIEKSLNDALSERDILISEIFDAIAENDGILQKDIYNLFPIISQADIQHIIQDFESNKKIVRIKKSNTYELRAKMKPLQIVTS